MNLITFKIVYHWLYSLIIDLKNYLNQSFKNQNTTDFALNLKSRLKCLHLMFSTIRSIKMKVALL